MFGRKRILEDGHTHGDQGFITRYQKGRPWEGYADQEVLDRYRQVVPRLTPREFAYAAQEAVSPFSRQDRHMLGQYLQHQAVRHGIPIATRERSVPEDRFGDAEFLGQYIASINGGWKAGLEPLLSAPDDSFDSMLAKGALAGIVAAAIRIPAPVGASGSEAQA
jgi:hypothetical protein